MKRNTGTSTQGYSIKKQYNCIERCLTEKWTDENVCGGEQRGTEREREERVATRKR